MVRKVKGKKSGIGSLAGLLLKVGIAALLYKVIIMPGYQHIFAKESDPKISSYAALKTTPGSAEERGTQAPSSKIGADPAVPLAAAKLNSPNVILVRLKDHTVLLEKNSAAKIYPASLTKIMTAIVAIENLPDLKKTIKLTNSTFQGLYGADASLAGFQAGEQVRAIDLLYGVMLPSGAECCIGLAGQVGGSEQNFVKMMNQKAADLGMKNTRFENATGLHAKNHYTTVKDLAILLSYALQNDTFREIFTSSRYSTSPTNKHPGGITFYSTMFEDLNQQKVSGGEILGGKTGYTAEAGLCLASLANVGKQEYILISAGAKGDHRSEQYNISDAVTVYNSLGK